MWLCWWWREDDRNGQKCGSGGDSEEKTIKCGFSGRGKTFDGSGSGGGIGKTIEMWSVVVVEGEEGRQ